MKCMCYYPSGNLQIRVQTVLFQNDKDQVITYQPTYRQGNSFSSGKEGILRPGTGVDLSFPDNATDQMILFHIGERGVYQWPTEMGGQDISYKIRIQFPKTEYLASEGRQVLLPAAPLTPMAPPTRDMVLRTSDGENVVVPAGIVAQSPVLLAELARGNGAFGNPVLMGGCESYSLMSIISDLEAQQRGRVVNAAKYDLAFLSKLLRCSRALGLNALNELYNEESDRQITELYG